MEHSSELCSGTGNSAVARTWRGWAAWCVFAYLLFDLCGMQGEKDLAVEILLEILRS